MADINETVAEVLRLDAQATRGPWDYWFEVGTRLGPDREHPIALVKQMRHARCPGGAGVDADAALITYYRTAAPALAREVQRLQAEVQRLQAELTTAHRTWAERCSAWSDGMEEAEASRDAARAEMREAQIGHDCALVAAYESGLRAGQEAMRERAAALCRARADRYAAQVEQREPGSGGRIVADARSAEAEACADAIRALEVEVPHD